MSDHKKEKVKFQLHPRNKHRERYDFKQLIESCPELASFVTMNFHNEESIDFTNPEAVKILNKAILKFYYEIESWDIPSGYLCPPIPGRADYIHRIADILGNHNRGKVPTGNQIRCLDIGVGAGCVYPVIGNKEYGWSFVGSDIDSVSIESSNSILESNPQLNGQIELRWQKNTRDIFYGIIQKDELFDLSICYPPFHDLLPIAEDAHSEVDEKQALVIGKYNNELCYEGGEERFLKDLIRQSKNFSASCLWFSTLVSKQSHVKNVYEALQKAEAIEIKDIPMGQGVKAIHMVAWTFSTREQQQEWMNTRWNVTKEKDPQTL